MDGKRNGTWGIPKHSSWCLRMECACAREEAERVGTSRVVGGGMGGKMGTKIPGAWGGAGVHWNRKFKV